MSADRSGMQENEGDTAVCLGCWLDNASTLADASMLVQMTVAATDSWHEEGRVDRWIADLRTLIEALEAAKLQRERGAL